MSRSKSILLQVAFKEAVSATLGTDKSVAAQTKEFYETLIALHDDLGITIEDGGGRSGGTRAPRESKPLPSTVIEFTDADGVQWVDYRPAKAASQVKPNFPDFKTADNKRSEWLFGQDGSENEAAVELAKASDALAGLMS